MQFVQKISGLTLAVLLGVFSVKAEARDLTHRLAVGIKNNTSLNLPSVGGIYYADKDMAFTGIFGIDTEKNNSAMQAGAGVRKVVFFENNLNAYWTGQAAFVSTDTLVAGKNSGIDAFVGGGVEFFFSGLENLSFSVEAGVGVSSLHNTRLYTSAQDPFHAGIMFYF